jgi:hypothetical protein
MVIEEKKASFFTTVPGILTGLAALITAITGILIWRGSSPSDRPPVDLMNITQNSVVTASSALPAQPPSLAADGNIDTSWNAGGPPVQWIDLELSKSADLVKLRLTPEQLPTTDDTRHVILGSTSKSSGYEVLHEFEGKTTDKRPLVYTPTEPWRDIDHLKIETTTGRSWVSWREIEIYTER